MMTTVCKNRAPTEPANAYRWHRPGLSLLSLTAAFAALLLAPVASAQDNSEDPEVEEIIVTGSYIKGTPADAISPVQTLSHEDLVASGVSDFAEAIRNLEIASGSDTFAQDTTRFTNGSGSGLANVALRGLGPTSTLVMLDGKRMPFAGQKLNDGDRFVDINQIPITMIDRVEVLKDGGSALYGSDAIAGIVNFITRDEFEGFELSVKSQAVSTGSSEDTTLGAIYGWGSESGKTHLVVATEIFDRTIQFRRDRLDLYQNRYTNQDVSGALVVRSLVIQNQGTNCTDLGYVIDNSELTDPRACSWRGSSTFVSIPPLKRENFMLNFKQDIGGNELYASVSNLNMLSGEALSAHAGPLEPKFFFPSLLGYGRVLAAGGGTITAATALGTSFAVAAAGGTIPTGVLGTQRDAVDTARTAAIATQPLPWDTQNVQLRLLLDTITSGLNTGLGAFGQSPLDSYFQANPASLGLWASNPGAPGDPSLVGAGGPLPAAPIPASLVFTGGPFTAAVPLPADLVDFALRAPGIEPVRKHDYTSEQATTRFQLGFRGEFGDDQVWNYDVSWANGTSTYQTTNLGIDKDRLELALYGLGGPNCTPNGAVTMAEAGTDVALAGAVFASRNLFAGNDNRLDISATEAGSQGAFEATILTFIGNTPGFPFLNVDNLILAMTSTNQGAGGCTFYNPYLTRATAAGANSDELLRWLEVDLSYLNDSETSLNVVDFVLSTEFSGGGGLALGLQFRNEERSTRANPQNIGTVNSFGQLAGGETVFALSENANFTGDRDISAAFAEAQISLHPRLRLQAAARFEDYGGRIGASFDPKLALRWEVSPSAIVRGSISSSFRGPGLAQTNEGSGYNLEFGILDPIATRGAADAIGVANGPQCVRTGRCDPITNSTVIAVKRGLPSPDLDPEKATILNLGFVLASENSPLTLSLDYYRIDFEDKIIDVPTQFYLAQELALFQAAKEAGDYVLITPGAGATTCDPTEAIYDPGAAMAEACQVNRASYSLGSTIIRRPDITHSLQIVEGPVINTGRVLTSGLDLGISYSWDLQGSNLLLSGNLSNITEYSVSDFPVGLPDFEASGSTNRLPTRRLARSIPDMKGSFSALWNVNRQHFLWTMRLIGAYEDNALQVLENELGPYYALDFRYTYRLALGSNNLDLSVGGIDLLDADLPQLRVPLGTDVTAFDPRGQRLYVSATLRL